MGSLYLILLIVFYIISRQWNTFCHELGHALFILKFTKYTEVKIVIGSSIEEYDPIYETGRLQIFYKFFLNFWKGGYCTFEDEEKFSLNEYLLIVLGGPLASLISALIYGLLIIYLKTSNEIITMFLGVLFFTASIDFFWNILPIKLSNKVSINNFVIDNDGYLIKLLLKEKFHFYESKEKDLVKKNYQQKNTFSKDLNNDFKQSYKDFIPYFGKDRFNDELITFIRKFGNYKLSSQSFPNDITYFQMLNTNTDSYFNEVHGFELIFKDTNYNDASENEYPEKLILTEIIFGLEKLNEKSFSSGLNGMDSITLINKVFPDIIFQGELPGNIFVNDSQEIVIKKLGEPLKSDTENNCDIFISDDNNLVFKIYYNDSNIIKCLSISPVENEYKLIDFDTIFDEQ